MITLYQSQSGTPLGEISEAQLAFLTGQLEEEVSDDRDYYINEDTIAALQEAGADPELVALLERATAESGETDIRWSRS